MSANPTSERKLRAQAVDWLLRLQDKPEDDALEADFQAWLSVDPARKVIYQRVQRVMGDASHLLSNDVEFARNAAQRALPRPRSVVAAVLVLLAGSGIFFLADGPMRLRADVITGVGQPKILTLDDGSKVELNANSAIAIDLRSNERRVTLLRGEAYFQVAADRSRPFVVAAGNATTTALGTAFDINLTSEGTRVIVTEHAVMVAPADIREKRQVNQLQQLSYDQDGQFGAIEQVDPDMAIAWRQGRLAFDNRSLSAVVEEIARYIPGRIVIAQTALADRRISGSLNLAAPIETLGSFAEAFHIRVTHVGPYLTILSK